MSSVWDIFSTRGFPARWSCGPAWTTEPVWGWIHIVSDVVIWGAYTAIPVILIWFLRRRPEIPFSKLFWLFSLFILACGTTHLVDALVFWWPAYRLTALMKMVTAIVSCMTVAALIPAFPLALTLRSPKELEGEIQGRTRELQDLTKRLQAEITARSIATANLEASDTRLRLVLQAGEMGTWDWELDSNILYSDAVEQQLTGLADDGDGIPFDAFLAQVLGADRPALTSAMDEAISNGIDFRHEFRFRRPNGSLRWLASRGRVLGRTATTRGHFVGVSFDVTDRRQMLEDLNLKTEAIQSATNAIVIVDVEQERQPLIYMNPAFCHLSGYEQAEVMGKNCRFLQGAETDRETVARIRRAIQDREACVVNIRNYRKDGSAFWNELRISPVSSADGPPTHYIGIQSDITDRVQTEEALVQAREQAESANVAKTQFLANMSHEIRTPLTAILGCADALYRQMKEEEPLELVKMVKDQGELLLGILNDVLDVSKIEAGKLEVRQEECQITTIVTDICSLMQPLAVERGLQLVTEYKSQIPQTIVTDPLRLRQILLNLTGNAIKFTEAGKVGILVRCELDQEPPQLVIDVVDTGIGIDSERLNSIFEPFTQLEVKGSQSKKSGTGLGLTICRSLVQLLGGRMSVRSVPNEGSRFTIRLPLSDRQSLQLRRADELLQPRFERKAEDSLAVLIPCRVLIAEDTRGLQFMLKRMLQDFVAGVEVVSNGREALEAVELAEAGSQPFDLILMDMQMPEMNGFEATRELRNRGFTRPIVALTAGAMSGDREKCLAAGCNDYLTKPVDRARLLTTLISYFDVQ